MFSVADLKISVSSFEFSIFCQESCILCPNCGTLLETNTLSEVRLSSLLLLLGVGSFVCYKLIIEKKKKKKRFPFGFSSFKNKERFTEMLVISEDWELSENYNVVTSTPFVNLCRSPSLASSADAELPFNLTDIVEGNDSSMSTIPSFHTIGNNTVAKLDQLLHQIEDIKKSVVEIDEQIFDVKESNVKFDPTLFILEPEMSSSLNSELDSNERFNGFNTEPQTPSLEWDLTDLNSQNYNSNVENGLISSFGSSYLKHNSFLRRNSFSNHNLEKLNNTFDDLESPQDLSSPSISTSGEFSISSSLEKTINSNNSLAIQKIIDEANKLGLLNDLMHILKSSKFKRDSAYFED